MPTAAPQKGGWLTEVYAHREFAPFELRIAPVGEVRVGLPMVNAKCVVIMGPSTNTERDSALLPIER